MANSLTTQRAVSFGALLAIVGKILYERNSLFRLYFRRLILAVRCLSVVAWRRYWRGPIQPGWTFIFEFVIEFLRFGPPKDSLSFTRQHLRYTMSRLPIGTMCEKVDVDGIPSEWITCCGVNTPNVVLYLHGGGYALMSIQTHKPLIARLSRAANARCLGIDYRLAPEHPFPAAIEDAIKAYRWLVRNQGVNPARIIIAGDSAGGGLTLATLMSLRDLGDPMPAAGILISPWVDLTCSMPSWKRNHTIDYLGKAPGPNQPMTMNLPHLYAAGRDLKHPLISPMYANLKGISPILIQLGGVEVFLDEGLVLAKKAKEAQVDVTVEVWPHMPHVFQVCIALNHLN
eukprot:TRINITY_DN5070_c0_g2_i3.p1 TRINITY_DN5070_c0_g2~~TRINITY_DN5070_c0_g2_i3.p1  ORF type:complete len:343 (+),score=54.68 TRINITY_DN5070_c0_g2_i3:44-1072(+)